MGTLTFSSNRSKNFASAPAFTLSSALTSTHPCGAVVVTFDTDIPVEFAVPVTDAPVEALSDKIPAASRLRKIVASARPANAFRPMLSYSSRGWVRSRSANTRIGNAIITVGMRCASTLAVPSSSGLAANVNPVSLGVKIPPLVPLVESLEELGGKTRWPLVMLWARSSFRSISISSDAVAWASISKVGPMERILQFKKITATVA